MRISDWSSDVCSSDLLPHEVSTAAQITPRIALNIPIVSAAMDTVTEGRLAIAMARQGGMGIIHRNLSGEEQVAEVDQIGRASCRERVCQYVYIPVVP